MGKSFSYDLPYYYLCITCMSICNFEGRILVLIAPVSVINYLFIFLTTQFGYTTRPEDFQHSTDLCVTETIQM